MPPFPPYPPFLPATNRNRRPLAVALIVLLAVLLAGVFGVSTTRMVVAYYYSGHQGTAYEGAWKRWEEQQKDYDEGGYDEKGTWLTASEWALKEEEAAQLWGQEETWAQEHHIYRTNQKYRPGEGRGPFGR